MIAPEWIDLVHRLADQAGDIARRHFRRQVAVSTKADATPVSEADRQIEATLRATLRAARWR